MIIKKLQQKIASEEAMKTSQSSQGARKVMMGFMFLWSMPHLSAFINSLLKKANMIIIQEH